MITATKNTNAANLLTRINAANPGARRIVTRLLREGRAAHYAGETANIDDNRTKTGKPSRASLAMVRDVAPDLLSFIDHILDEDQASPILGQDEASGAPGIAALAAKVQAGPSGEASPILPVGSEPSGEAFRPRAEGETWGAYYAARKAWARAQG